MTHVPVDAAHLWLARHVPAHVYAALPLDGTETWVVHYRGEAGYLAAKHLAERLGEGGRWCEAPGGAEGEGFVLI